MVSPILPSLNLSDLADPHAWWILTNQVGILLLFVAYFLALWGLWRINRLKVILFRLSPDILTQWSNSADLRYKSLASFRSQPQGLLLTFLLLNLSLHAFLFCLSFQWLYPFFEIGLSPVLACLGLTGLLFFIGETLPAMIPINTSKPGPYRLMRWAMRFFSPLTSFLIWANSLLEKYIEKKEQEMVLEEIQEIIEEPENQDEKEILQGIFNFSHLTVRQIMKPRLEMIAFPYQMNFHQLLDKINKYAYSRIPVFHESLDKIEGILYIKDLLPYIQQEEDFPWQRLLRTPYYVPEGKRIEELLRDFQEKRVHMAIVADEYGGTAGLVTLDDIVEQILGSVQYEFDKEALLPYKQLDEHTYVFEAKTSLLEFNRILGIDPHFFDQVRGESESLAGLVLELFGRIPKTGEKITFESFTFLVISADIRRLKKIRVEISQAKEAENT
jgi:putative hemolysin